MTYENMTRAKDNKNGIRQPQALNATSPTFNRVVRITPMETNKPKVAVV